MAPKKKVEKMSLGDFLGDQSLGSWADEMEDHMPAPESRGGFGERRAFSSAGGFGSSGGTDRFAGYATRQALPLPSKPPYTVHLGNLPFDATDGDVEDFFVECEVTSVRIVEDKLEHKPKGFGYVEFGSVEGLKKALELDGRQFNGRNIRISVAEPSKDRQDTRVFDDWTRKGPLPDLPQQQRRASERGGFDMERGGSRRGQGGPPEGDGKVRDFGNWERKGPLSPAAGEEQPRGSSRVRSNDGPKERKLSPAWGEARDGSRPPRGELRERQPFVEKAPSAADLDTQWRSRMKPDQPAQADTPTPDTSAPASPAQLPAAPAGRPRLNLQKRTVSEAEPSPSMLSADSTKPNPFGNARPIDTAAREREVVEKREMAIRAKKEQDEKFRDERKAKETAAKTAAAEGASTPTTAPGSTNGDSKENEADEAKGPIRILTRIDDEGSGAEGTDTADASENGEAGQDQTTRSKEFIREPPKGPKNQERGGWRRKPSGPPTPSSPSVPTGEKVEDDGWNTVPSANKRGRGRGGPGRPGVTS